jgi:LAO/AO transport system kinase
MQGLWTNCDDWVSPVVRTIATSGVGISELMEAVERCAAPKPERKRRIGFSRSANGLRLDHVGIAVKSIAAAQGFYEALGLVVSGEETVEHEKVRTAMLPLGESRIELLEATAENSTTGRFLAKRGEGLHHIAVHVDEVDAMFDQLMSHGIRLASDAVRVGAGGHRYFFVHPASTGGVLVEIVGDADSKMEGA